MPKRYRYTKPKTFLTIVLSIFLLFMICTAVILPDLASRMDILRQQNEKKDDKYIVRMRELFEENETITLKDIFNDFDFAYAYVFNDPNINGETLAKRYELDLNLSNVKELNSDHYRRIIFLDENKEVVFNWVYSVYEVLILVEDTMLSLTLLYPGRCILCHGYQVRGCKGRELLEHILRRPT